MKVEFAIKAKDLDEAERTANRILCVGVSRLKVSKPKLIGTPKRIKNAQSGAIENEYTFHVACDAKDLAEYPLRKWLDDAEDQGARLISPKFTTGGALTPKGNQTLAMSLGADRVRELGLPDDSDTPKPSRKMSPARRAELGIA